ncbi:MAG: cyclic nucleotide-binding domain-containing protein [Deltaproteobacteria bacterium]|nr:cyclic nucleotide-binding domain-containing protein [Deltaproteobacteria bacterium]MBW2071211.1 cyclic nucleotide-binding domain-containing protein [Deltaproteobacteria bacterium]
MTTPIDLVYVRDEESYSDGEVIFEEGGFSDWLYIILEGQVKITKNTPKGQVTTARLRQGDFLGEIEFLDPGKQPRAATATAIGEVRLGVMDRDKLQREYESLSPAFRKIIRSLARRSRRTALIAARLAIS